MQQIAAKLYVLLFFLQVVRPKWVSLLTARYQTCVSLGVGWLDELEELRDIRPWKILKG